MHEKPEKRDVVNDINPEGRHDDEKTADVREDVHEKPEKRDNIESNDSPLLKQRLSYGMLNFQF
jgi:hypothetical protein